MKRLIPAILMLAAVAAAAAAPAAAQSYDCAKAATPDEIAVCGDPLLSELDTVQAAFYRRLRHYTTHFDNAMGLQAQLRDEARAFLRRRAACGADRACLERVYRARILRLLEWWRRAME